MPPVAGALNGAMVLRDSSISNMEYDQITDVIKPKVLGSIHLDRIFHDVKLDWFILISSINCVIGNVGQANVSCLFRYLSLLACILKFSGSLSRSVTVDSRLPRSHIILTQRAVVRSCKCFHV
jgi:hypothetical protein